MSDKLLHFTYVEMNEGNAVEGEPDEDEEVYVVIRARREKDGMFWPLGDNASADPFYPNECEVLGWFREDEMGP